MFLVANLLLQSRQCKRQKRQASSSTISLIIPAHNESDLLPRLLDTVDIARERFDRRSEAIEVIVVDNACTDNTANIATDRGCRVKYVEKRSIAAARNGGANVADRFWYNNDR